ncbi:MAG: hypothetical protein Q8N84_03800 [bacterium]|nr:hypothetical protein [bacterium]
MSHEHHEGTTAMYLLHRDGNVIMLVHCHALSCEALTANLHTWYSSLGDYMSSCGFSDGEVLIVELDSLSVYWVVYFIMTDGGGKVAVPVLRMRQLGEENGRWDVQVIDGQTTSGQNAWATYEPVQGAVDRNLIGNLGAVLALLPDRAIRMIGASSLRYGFKSWQKARQRVDHPRRHIRHSSPAA